MFFQYAGIRSHDLWNMSLLPYPLDQGSRPALFLFVKKSTKFLAPKDHPNEKCKINCFQNGGEMKMPSLTFSRVGCCSCTYLEVRPDVEIKRSPNAISCLTSSQSSFNWKGMFFKVAQKVNICLENSSEKICHQKLSKLSQSGHTTTQAWR